MAAQRSEFVVECFWPDVDEDDLSALDERTLACVAALAGGGEDVEYLGSLLIRRDEVVLCRFAGTETSVRRAADAARVPYERILLAGGSPWRTSPGRGTGHQ